MSNILDLGPNCLKNIFRQNLKISVSSNGSDILGRGGTHFLIIFFSGKNMILSILKGEMPFKNA